MAVIGEWEPDGEPAPSEIAARFLPDPEIVVAEGYKRAALTRIEVHRSEIHRRPLYDPGRPDAHLFLAVVTDRDDLDRPLPVLGLDAPGTIGRLADLVEERVSNRVQSRMEK